MFCPFPLAGLCVGAGALSPEKGGALRKQSTRGRRLGVAAVLCGGVFGAPLLLLQHGSAHAARVATASAARCVARRAARADVSTAWSLPSQLVATSRAPPRPHRRPRRRPRHRRPPPTTTTTTTTAPRRRPRRDSVASALAPGDADHRRAGDAATRAAPAVTTARRASGARPRGTPRPRRGCAPARRFRSGPS